MSRLPFSLSPSSSMLQSATSIPDYPNGSDINAGPQKASLGFILYMSGDAVSADSPASSAPSTGVRRNRSFDPCDSGDDENGVFEDTAAPPLSPSRPPARPSQKKKQKTKKTRAAPPAPAPEPATPRTKNQISIGTCHSTSLWCLFSRT